MGVIQYPNSYWPLDASAPAVVEHQNFSTTLLGQKTRTIKHGNTGARGPDKINIFTSSVQWIVQPSQCFVNIATLKMATKCHEDGVQNTLTFNDICRGFCAPSFSKFYFLEKNCFSRQFFSSVANSWNKSLSTLFFLHAY